MYKEKAEGKSKSRSRRLGGGGFGELSENLSIMENPEHVLMELNTFEKEPLDNLPKVGLKKVVWFHVSDCGH